MAGMVGTEAIFSKGYTEPIPIPSRMKVVRELVNDFTLTAAGKLYTSIPTEYFKPQLIEDNRSGRKMWEHVRAHFRSKNPPDDEKDQSDDEVEWMPVFKVDNQFEWHISYSSFIDGKKGLSEKDRRSAQMIRLRRRDSDGIVKEVLIEQFQDPDGNLSITGSWHELSRVVYEQASHTSEADEVNYRIENSPQVVEKVNGLLSQFNREIPESPTLNS